MEHWQAKQCPDGEVEVSLKPWKDDRTQAQNRYWWGVVVPTFYNSLKNLGIELIDEEEAHEALKIKFLSRTIEVKGKTLRLPRSTAKLKKDEFAMLIHKINGWLIHNIGTALPEPYEYENLEKMKKSEK